MRNLSALLVFVVLSLGMVACQTGSSPTPGSVTPPPPPTGTPPAPPTGTPPPPPGSSSVNRATLVAPMQQNPLPDQPGLRLYGEAVVACNDMAIEFQPEVYAQTGFDSQYVGWLYHYFLYDYEAAQWVYADYTEFSYSEVPQYSPDVDFTPLASSSSFAAGAFYVITEYWWFDGAAWKDMTYVPTTTYIYKDGSYQPYCYTF